MLIRFGGLVALIGVAVWLWALFDALTAPADRVRLMPKGLWVLAVLLLLDVGGVAWFLLGRPRAAAAPGGGGTGGVAGTFGRVAGGSRLRAPARAPVAPDDDPDFLRQLGEDMRRERDDPS